FAVDGDGREAVRSTPSPSRRWCQPQREGGRPAPQPIRRRRQQRDRGERPPKAEGRGSQEDRSRTERYTSRLACPERAKRRRAPRPGRRTAAHSCLELPAQEAGPSTDAEAPE